jgi:formylglycine-generating enzyme required for sulfatase activity
VLQHLPVLATLRRIRIEGAVNHDEAITYTRQTLSYPPPAFNITQNEDNPIANEDRSAKATRTQTDKYITGDAEIPGAFFLGSTPEHAFAFDNEQLAPEVEIGPFAISRTTVTNGEFKDFLEDCRYGRKELWTEEGWRGRTSACRISGLLASRGKRSLVSAQLQ